MVTLLSFSCAFLEHDSKLLLMKRAPDRKIHPNYWSGVGGKIEALEATDPYSACLREIHEETGISSDQIRDLTLRYLLLRRHGDAIWQSYIYFGNVPSKPERLKHTDEGTLHWVPKRGLLQKRLTVTYAVMLRHSLSPAADKQAVFVGAAEKENGGVRMAWSKMGDFTD